MTFVPVERTAEIVQERQRLPIFTLESEIIEQLSSSNVLLICGETGSGKTTQVPQFLWEHGYGHPQGKHRGLIGVTEPRRLAATSVCARVAEELGESGKGTVAYQIRYESTFQKGKTRLKFMTDGILLRELENDPLLWDYSVIIIDEAHDRAVNTDILLGCLSRVISIREKIVDLSKQIGQKASGSGVENRMFEDLNHLYGLTRDKIDTVLRSKNNFDYLKLIVMSATLQVEIFAQNKLLFPQQVPVIRIPGRQYPIVIHFNRITPPDCISAALDKVIKIHSRLPSGDILVFMPGRVEVEELTRRLRQTFPQNEHIGRKTSIKKKQIEQKDNQGKILSSDNKDVDYGLFVSDEEFEKFANDNFHIDVEIDDNDDKNTEMDKNESFNEQLITEQIIEKDFIINNKNENEGGITFDDNEDDILEKQKPLKRKRGGKKHHHNIINIETSIEEKSEEHLHSSTKNKRRRFIEEEEDYFNKVETKNLDKEQLNQLVSEQGDMNHNVNQDEYQEEEDVIVLNASIMTQEQLEKEKEMGNINLNGIIQDDDEEDQYSSSNSESYYTNKQKMKLKRIETDSTEEKQQQKKKKQKRNKLGQKYLIVYPLYSLLPSYLQRRIFNQEKENDFVRKVIVATNIAETSLTIPGIRYVVDSGLVKERIYNSVTGVITLQAVWESVASADQRAGRAGRVGPGHCYRLFSSSVQQNIFSKYSQPELLRMPLDHVLLSIISMTQSQTEDEQIKQPFSLFQSVRDFPFPTPPAMDDIDNALTLLRNLGAIQIQKKELKDQFTNQNNHKKAPLALAIVAAASVRELFISFIPSRKDNDEDKESDDDKESDEESNIETLNQKLLRQSSKKENRVSKKLEKEQKHVESQFQALVHAFWSSKAFGSDLLAEMAALQYFAHHMLTSSTSSSSGHSKKGKYSNRSQQIDPTWLHYIVPLELLSPAKVVSDSSYPPPIQYLQKQYQMEMFLTSVGGR
ncbi:MAG: putative ATP-dependent RNA helicase DEAH13 [Streblomastix strix]|uniref:Putative ATP-dependent RNA helicase DEAH13 n=1 Tax=Streblomastix strix TaxID=222440 RepID=A0A5J4X419_9EUKA|nr:MAG: putative ATP-dependent RNA helicase DEAH13 [Streblomastix strix]